MTTTEGSSRNARAAIQPGRSVAVVARDRIYVTTRVLAASIVPFLVVGVYVLYVRTDQTRQLWAWEIRSPMSSLMLASAYGAGAYFFARVAFARRWHHVARGLLPVLAFASLMAVVTVIHWPLFLHRNVAFSLWTALYVTTPFLIAAAWWLNRREETGRPDQTDVVIPVRVRRIIGGAGMLGLVATGLLLVVPGLLIQSWAWPLTALTARVIGVIFALFNVYLLSLSIDPRWSAARLTIESLAVALILIVVGIVRTRDTFLWSRPSAWLVPIVIVVGLITCLLTLTMVGRADGDKVA
jgi:hypothetical protein